MIINIDVLKQLVLKKISTLTELGYDVETYKKKIEKPSSGYDELLELCEEINNDKKLKDDEFSAPFLYEEVKAACDPDRNTGLINDYDKSNISERVKSAFLSSVSGCILGKPLECNPTLEEIKKAAKACNEWPISDYISEKLIENLGKKHRSAGITTRENIKYVAPDDDINYRIIGMVILEEKGIDFTTKDIAKFWLENLPVLWTFGPERHTLTTLALLSNYRYFTDIKKLEWDEFDWDEYLKIMDLLSIRGITHCGAQIRVDTYGYACPGRPETAAYLAYKDALLTHQGTGLYAPMFIAAAISCAFVLKDPVEIFNTAKQYIPQKSRFYQVVIECINEVKQASDWIDGYNRIHKKYIEYDHCKILQETGTVINTLKFADSISDGICKQVMQGNDTDCYGAIAGSLLGAVFNAGSLEGKWLKPFNNTIHTSLANFHEQNLSMIADRMGALPDIVEKYQDTQL